MYIYIYIYRNTHAYIYIYMYMCYIYRAATSGVSCSETFQAFPNTKESTRAFNKVIISFIKNSLQHRCFIFKNNYFEEHLQTAASEARINQK